MKNIDSIYKLNFKNKKIFLFFICIILFISVFLYYKNKNTKDYFTNNKSDIIVNKNTIGFFACCCDILKHIIDYYNTNKKIPDSVDTSLQFDIYKPSSLKDDITYHFFKKSIENNNNNINIENNIDFGYAHQYYKYSDIKYNELQPFIETYFSPSQDILNIQKQLLDKYNINVDQYCAVYYRGTDKKTETTIGTFDTYIDKMNDLLNTDNNIKFIIQSDNQEFIDIVKSKIQNCISFDENVASYTDKGIHNENTPDDNYIIMKNFLAIVLIMSKCKYIICSSGNCSLWIMLFKGNGKNVKQFLNNEWF